MVFLSLLASTARSLSTPSSAIPKVLFLGTPDVAATSFKSIVEASRSSSPPFTMIGAVTQPPRHKGRKKILQPTPVHVAAEEEGVRVFTPENAKDEQFLEELEALSPDLCITAAYGCYLPKRFLAIPRLGTVNIHPSLLPRWRGASPVQRSLEAGDEVLGVSVLYTVSKMDAGPVIARVERKNDGVKPASQELEELFSMGTDSLISSLPSIFSGEMTFDTADPQDELAATKAPMIDKSEAVIDFATMSAVEVHNRVRGLELWPGCHFYVEEVSGSGPPRKVKLGRTRVIDDEEKLAGLEGRGVALLPGKGAGLGVLLADGTGLELLTVQPEGKKMMDAKAYANGLTGKIRWRQ
eukprot:CAMPEP_0182461928 /NCGR_PEP_ID=MMETSP1319-20130603/6362_1 /TAXON_ID=172717 /ORGANISM="Bolidomonas pacifica, Strain RCC208" /LENGTH=352 /DNA_ID=CAMNT_0024661287 /DNA_START=189 /DNA_END=1244 /DNA_ORIENTATION=+